MCRSVCSAVLVLVLLLTLAVQSDGTWTLSLALSRTRIGQALVAGYELVTRQCSSSENAFRVLNPENKKTVKNNVRMVHYTKTRWISYRLDDAADIPESPGFNKSLRTVIFIHGYLNTPNSESSELIVSSYLSKKLFNVLVLDYGHYMHQPYDRASNLIPLIGSVLTDYLVKVYRNGIKPKMVHIVGFSLGAHVAGISGRDFEKRIGLKISRITALDPAGPCFSGPNNKESRLQKNDASFVDVIHTNQGILGLLEPIGHADFYANGDDGVQPMCKSQYSPIVCSHSTSWHLYSESVLDERKLLGRRCLNWESLVTRNCSGIRVPAGFSTLKTVRGIYLLKRRSQRS